MCSNEEDSGGKRLRTQHACDLCRRKKNRCDAAQMQGKCTTCRHENVECTFLTAAVKRAPPKSYVDSLEEQLDQSLALIRQLRSQLANAQSELAVAQSNNNSNPTSSSQSDMARSPTAALDGASDPRLATLTILRAKLRAAAVPAPAPHGDDLVHFDLARNLEQLSLGQPPATSFFGKGSGASLITAALDFKANIEHEEREAAQSRDNTPGQSLSETSGWQNDDGSLRPVWARRLQFWKLFTPARLFPLSGTESSTFLQWERTPPRAPDWKFPPAAMLNDLIALYFMHQNLYVPLLHRPTFERSVAEGLHLSNGGFAATVLLVCAVASRWSTDSEVGLLSADERVGAGNLSYGWQWFDQARYAGGHILGPATVYDLQYYCHFPAALATNSHPPDFPQLAAQFLDGSCAPQSCWTLIGFGLRLAQDIGAHRRAALNHCVPGPRRHTMLTWVEIGTSVLTWAEVNEVPSVRSESQKRALWVLVYMDNYMSAATGRPSALEDSDIDVEMPIECDDEYWEHPTHPFQQPPGVPSRITFFSCLLRLNFLLALSSRILYSLNKTRAAFSLDEAFEANLVTELDSAMNSWHEQIPEHLRWDPARENPVFFNQSVALHCEYKHLVIYVHKRFLREATPVLPSLAICTSAARACVSMVDIQRRRMGNVPTTFNLIPAFTSGIVLLLNVWSGKRTGVISDTSREMANVYKCMEVVRLCEDRDILAELASAGGLPLPGLTSFTDDGVSPPYSPSNVPFEPPQPPLMSSDTGSQFYTSEYMEPSAFALTGNLAPSTPSENLYPPIPTDPAEVSRELGEMMSLIDNDVITMWASAPTGLGMDDWGNYFNGFSEITQGQPLQ
ncbi:fungal-specific transcription factor domain-containing protein [Mycena metata]|uniref:Fungal-specific transcription factor domain-containing protein n=1 Tax=Mycena metata TaxID=1033252 RepID=A0AAD7MYX4_9AGAR|nr:fungal-specific transcription factor domain-containing protein [Mycena metata]